MDRRRRHIGRWLMAAAAALIACATIWILTATPKPPRERTIEPRQPASMEAEVHAARDPAPRPRAADRPDATPGPVPAPGGDVRIVGCVSSEGPPVPRARVKAIDANGKPVGDAFGARTDEEGRFEIDVPPGTAFPLALRAEMTGYLDEMLTVQRPEELRDELRIELGRGLSISGTLRDDAGSPVRDGVVAIRIDASGEPVRVKDRIREPRALSFALADDRGEFTISGLLEGAYLVTAPAPRYTKGEGSSVKCRAGASGVALLLYRACAVRFVVVDSSTGTAVSGPVVIRFTDDTAHDRGGVTENGEAVARGLPPGTYSLHVTAPNYVAYDRESVEVRRIGETEVVELRLARTESWGFGSIEASVIWPESLKEESRPGLRVKLVGAGEDPKAGPIWEPRGPERALSFAKVPCGPYHLLVSTLDDGWTAGATPVTVRDGVTSRIEVVLQRGGRLSVRVEGLEELDRNLTVLVIDPKGVPLTVAEFSPTAEPSRRAAREGLIIAPLPPGTVTVVARTGDEEIFRRAVSVASDEVSEIVIRR